MLVDALLTAGFVSKLIPRTAQILIASYFELFSVMRVAGIGGLNVVKSAKPEGMRVDP
jgi:hypothetical protein